MTESGELTALAASPFASELAAAVLVATAAMDAAEATALADAAWKFNYDSRSK